MGLAAGLGSLAAQQGSDQPEPHPPTPATPAAQSETAPAVQEPGEGAQLRTGTASGLDIDTRLENLLADHEYLRIQAQLGQLPPDLAEIYRGVLANRSNNLNRSVQLLEPLVDQATASGNAAREKLVRMTLAEDYLRLGDWAKAGEAYQALDKRLHDKLSQDEHDEIEMPLKMLPLAKENPPTTVDACEPFRLQVSNDPLGLIDVPVFIDAASHSWMLDPTAPFNLISRSIAREVGLGISEQSATIRTLTGRPIQVHVTVIPRFTIGGRLTLHNVTAFVFDDADYYFPHSSYQVEGVLGYPALAAMGRLTVSDNAIQIDPTKEIDAQMDKDRLNRGAHFYLDGDQIIVAMGRAAGAGGGSAATDSPDGASEAGSASGSDDRMFAIDAGGQQTYLTSRWFDEHAAEFNHQKMQMFSLPGPDSAPVPAYTATTVPLKIGGAKIDLHYIPVLTQPLGSAARDDVYGVIGIDALDQFESYTFDYRTMRFSARGQ